MSEGSGNGGLGGAPGLGSGFQLGPILGSGLGRHNESNPLYYAQVRATIDVLTHQQSLHASYLGGHPSQSTTPPPRPQPGDAYGNNHLVPYLNQQATGEGPDMSAGAPTPLDAFYIQQASGSFNVPLDVPDVNAYDHTGAGGGLSSSGLPLRGPPNMAGWGAPSRPPGPGGPHDVQPHDEADVLHSGGHGYPASLGGMPPLPGSARNFSAGMYRPTDPAAHRHMMMDQEAGRPPRPVQKRQRTSPVPFGDSVDMQARFRAPGPGPGPGRPRLPSRGIPTRRDLDGAPQHGDGLGDLLPPGNEAPGAPGSDFASWILGPEDGQQRQQAFSMDPAAYYRQGMAPPSGIRLDMPGLSSAQQPIEAPKGLAPLRSQGPNSDDEPLYVNAKQYQRILKRRMARSRMEEKRRHMFMMAIKQREEKKNGGSAEISDEWVSGLLALDEEAKKPYQHESRHKHAMRRPRGPGGRFLTTEEIRKRDEEIAAQKAKEEDQNNHNAGGEGNTEGNAAPKVDDKPSTSTAVSSAPTDSDASGTGGMTNGSGGASEGLPDVMSSGDHGDVSNTTIQSAQPSGADVAPESDSLPASAA